jgi:hypothetical protein
VSPLEALIADVERNLTRPTEMGLKVRTEARTGDTSVARRNRQRVKSPHIYDARAGCAAAQPFLMRRTSSPTSTPFSMSCMRSQRRNAAIFWPLISRGCANPRRV